MKLTDNFLLQFEEKSHKYLLCSTELTSVTEKIRCYFSEFNPDEKIKMMMRSTNWCFSEYYGMSAEQIKKEWKLRKKLGISMHKAIENLIGMSSTENRIDKEKLLFLTSQIIEGVELENWPLTKQRTRTIREELCQFRDFVEDFDVGEDELWFPELRIYSPKIGIAGTIDLLTVDKEGNCKIYDWKRVKRIMCSNSKKGKDIFSYLDDCNFYHYHLQLNLYRYILETNYEINSVAEMSFVVFHRENENYRIYEIERDERVARIAQ